LITTPAYAQYFDTPGLLQKFEIETGGYHYEVQTTSNFDVQEVELNSDEKKLTLFIKSALENNLSEIQIPVNLINGNFTFFLNDQEFFPDVKRSERISLITAEFEGVGLHKLEIIGTTYLPEFSEIAPLVLATSIFGLLLLKRFKKLNL
jgi:hypothetical protein